MELRSYEERHAAACEVFEGFTAGQGDAERAALAMTRSLGALGTFAFDVVMGDIWARPQLSRRDRSMIVVSTLMALGSTEELSFHIQAALNHGVTRTEIDEVMLHIAVYRGFPRAMAASRVVNAKFREIDGLEPGEYLPERPAGSKRDDTERRDSGADVRQTLTGGRANPDPQTDMEGVIGLLGEPGRIAFLWAFGDVWSRPQLSRRDRSLVVISILTALGQTGELGLHVPGALNHGLTRVEIEEIMVQLTIYAGVPRALGGTFAMKAAFEKIDSASAN